MWPTNYAGCYGTINHHPSTFTLYYIVITHPTHGPGKGYAKLNHCHHVNFKLPRISFSLTSHLNWTSFNRSHCKNQGSRWVYLYAPFTVLQLCNIWGGTFVKLQFGFICFIIKVNDFENHLMKFGWFCSSLWTNIPLWSWF